MKIFAARALLLTVFAVFLWCSSLRATAGVRDFELLSINSADLASGSGASVNPVASSTGRYVAFASDASNLVTNDTNSARDIFWRDRVAGTTRLVSRTPAGASGDGESDSPVISADGRYVAFHSRAGNLVANDTNATYDVFLWDSNDNSVTLVSRTPTGASGAGDSYSPRLSANGRVVSFASQASNLVPSDSNATADAFARDMDTGVTYLVSISTVGTAGNGASGVPVISANGLHVAFLSRASNLVTNDFNTFGDIFVHDLQTRNTRLVSVDVAGTGAGNRLSADPAISADGRYIAFSSQATNLVTITDTNNFPDVFVRDMQGGVTKLVSVNGSGTATGGNTGVASILAASSSPFISADGTKVLFASLAQDLVPNDSNGKKDIFLRDHINNTTTLISTNRFGTGSGNAASGLGAYSMSADLRYVAFFSEASNIGTADTNNKTDVFLRDLTTGSTKIISRVSLGGFAANGHSSQPVISADGSTILFASEADNLDNRDSNLKSDVFAAATTLTAPTFSVVDVGVSITSVSDRTVGTPFDLTVTITNHSTNVVTGLVLGKTNTGVLSHVSSTVSQGVNGSAGWVVGDLLANATATATVTLVATNLGLGNVAVNVLRLDQVDTSSANDTATSAIRANRGALGGFFHFPGSLAYLSRNDSEFSAEILFGNSFTVEDFERGTFAYAGVTATTGGVLPPSGVTDSVDADDGVQDGSGTNGYSYYVGTNEVTFVFNAAVLGRLPTKVGVVVTDGHRTGAGFEVFGTNGVSLGRVGPFEIGDVPFTGETAEDRFIGVAFGGGILALRVFHTSPGFELDHLQFDIPTTDLAMSGSAPAVVGFGTNFAVTMTVTNRGTVTATGIVVTNADPGSVQFVGAFATQGTFDTNGTWTVGTLAPGASASLTLTLTVDESGALNFQAGVSSAVSDSHTPNDTFTLPVLVPNSPPTVSFTTFTLNLLEDAAAVSLPGFVQASALETNQTVTNITVSVSNPALFNATPGVGANGLLTFTLAPNANGSSIVTVQARDSGGIANGGNNLGSNSFTVAVTPVNDPPVFGFVTNIVTLAEDSAAQTLPGFIVSAGVGPLDESAAFQGLVGYTVTASQPALFATGPAIANNGTLTFAPAPNANGSATITVVAQDDGGTANGGVNRSTNTFTINLTPVNDAPTLVFATNLVVVGEDAGAQTVVGFATSSAVESGQSVTNYAVTAANGALFSVVPAVALNGTLTFTPAPDANGTTVVTVIAQDDGGTADGGVNRTTNTFSLTLTPVNDTPTLAFATNNVVVVEDAGAQSIAGFATFGKGPADEAGQTFTNLTITASVPMLFSVAPSFSGGSGTLIFTPAADVAGSSVVTVIVEDDGGTLNGGVNRATNTFTITITSVNDTPTISFATNNLQLARDLGAQTVAGFATLAIGPANEAGQAITNVSAAAANTALFSVQPNVAVNGTLTFTTAAGVAGSSLVTVIAGDDGGTANGGNNRVTNSFTITVTAVGPTAYTWLGGAGDWHDRTQWTPEGVPGAADSVAIGSGTVQLTNGVSVLGMTMAGGTLTGAGDLTIPAGGAFNWSAGTIGAGGALTVVAGGTLTMSGGATKTLHRQLDNAGTVTWTGGTIVANSNPTFNNQAGGVFDMQTDNTFFTTTDSSVRTFHNAGTVRKTAGTGTATWEGVVNNTGTVAVQTGTLNLTGSGLSSGVFTNAAGTVLSWSSGTHQLTTGATFTGPGTRRIAGGTVEITAGATVSPAGIFEQTSGALGGAGNFTVPSGSQFNWTAGTINTGGVFTVAAGGALTMSGAATKTLKRQFDNAGTVTWTGGTIVANSNSTFNNQAGGVFDMQTDNTFFTTTDSSVRTFNNTGTVRKTAGTGTATWEGVVNNTGTVAVQTGTLSLTGSGLSSGAFTNAAGTVLTWSGGTHQLTTGAAVTGPGTRRITGGTVEVTTGATVSLGGLFEQTGGTLGGAGNFTVPSGSQFNWTAGTINTGGVFTVAAGGTLTMSGGATKTLHRQLDNAGTVTWTGGTIVANSNPTFNNQAGGVFDMQTDNTFFTTTDGSVRTFNNAGTLRKTAGTGTTTWQGVFNSTGTVEVQTGTVVFSGGSGLWKGTATNTAAGTVQWVGGAYQLGSGVALTGDGNWRLSSGSLEVLDGVTVNLFGRFALSGGTLSGAGSFRVPPGNSFDWSNGQIATGGVFTVASGGLLNFTSGTKTLGRSVDNSGTVTWFGGAVGAANNPTFNNLAGGLLDVRADANFLSAGATFNNAGTVRKTVATGTTTWEGVFNNTGTVDVQTGTVLFSAGSGVLAGTATSAAGATVQWASGAYELGSGVALTGAGSWQLGSGSLDAQAGVTVTLPGTFTLSAGNMGGAGNFTVPAGAVFAWRSGTLNTGGVFTVATGGTMTMTTVGTKALKRQLDNAGTVTWTGGTVQGNNNPTFNNLTGAVFDMQLDGNFFQTTDASVRTFNNAGTVRKTAGTGTSTWEGTFNNTGTLELQTGTFNLPSGYAPAAGSALTVFIGGTTAGTQFARLVGGTTTFAGTLNVVLTNGFAPVLGNSFAVVDSSSGGSGAFGTVTGRLLGGGLALATNYSGGDLTLTTVAINTAPVVTFATNNVVVLEDSTTTTVTGFASASMGTTNETAQSIVSYALSPANPALFADLPSLSFAGVLSFRPATNAHGSTTMTLVARDNGGTADGGVDRSTNTFTITITPVNDAPTIALDLVRYNFATNPPGYPVGWGDYVVFPLAARGATFTNLAAGWRHNLAQKADGTLVGWGENSYSSTTIPAAATNVVALAVGQNHDLAVRADGVVVEWGFINGPQPADLTNVTAVSAGQFHSLALRGDGTVRVWGSGTAGTAANIPAGLANVRAIAAGGRFNLALLTNGTVVGWGDNTASAATNVPAGLSGVTAIAAGGEFALALRSDGTVVGWGENARGQTTIPGSATGVVALAACTETSVALRADGSVVAWGRNDFGQANVPAGLANVTAIRAYPFGGHVLALRADGSIVSWGEGDYGQTTDPAGPGLVQQVVGGFRYGMALKTDGTPMVWGAGGAPPAPPASATNLTALAGGHYHAVGLRADGTLVAWGSNGNGQTNVPAGLTSVAAIASQGDHTLVLLSNSTVVAFGRNHHGQTNVPAGLTNVIAVAGGDYHSLALKSDGTVVAWGANDHGQTNVPVTLTNAVSIACTDYGSFAVRSDGTIAFWGNTGGNGIATAVTSPRHIAGRRYHTLAVRQDETVYSSSTRIQPPTGLTRVVGIAGVGDSSLALYRVDAAALLVNEDAGAQSFANFATNITAGAGDTLQALSLTVTNDNNALFSSQPDLSAAGTLTFTPAANANGSATVTVWVTDTGGTANGGTNASAPQTFVLTVRAVNDAPVVTFATNNVVVLEDSAPYTQTSFAVVPSLGATDESAQSISSYLVTAADPTKFSKQPGIDTTGTLTFSLAQDAVGSTLVTVVSSDNGGTANGGVDRTTNTFTITLTEVNDAPSFTFSTNNVVVLEDAGAQSVANFIATRSVGPASETSSQTITNFTVTTTNAGFFAVAPAIGTNGTLTFRVAANTNGSTTLSVVARDNGGTPDSAAVTFTLTVTPVNDAPSFTFTSLPATDGAQNWVRGPASLASSGLKLVTDSQAHVIVAGDEQDNALSLPDQIRLVKYSNIGFEQWAKVIRSEEIPAVSGASIQVNGLAVDANDEVILLATLRGSQVNFLTMKYASDGSLVWSNRFAGHEPTALTVDANRNVIVSGKSQTAFYSDYFTVKYLPNGSLAWTNQTTYETVGHDVAKSVATDGSGNVYVTGDGSDTDYTFAYTVKLSGADGSLVWSNRFDIGGESSYGVAVAVDADGKVLAGAKLTDNINQVHFGVVKYTADGAVVWTNLYRRQPFGQEPRALAVDSSRNVYVTGETTAAGVADFTTLKFLADGTPAWTNHFSGDSGGADRARALALTADGGVVVTGQSVGPNGDDYLTVKYTADGVGVWTNRYNGTSNGSDIAYALGTDASTNVFVTGAADGVMRTIKYAYVPSPGAHQSVAASTAVTHTGFITSSSTGPADESGQAITSYLVSNNASNLFSVQPTISAAGELTYTTTNGAVGLATVTVQAGDDGGTANSGVSQSTNQTFYVGVLPSGSTGRLYLWNGGSGNWNTATNWTPTGVPGDSDFALISAGTVATTNEVSLTGLFLSGGSLEANHTVSTICNWSGGSLTGAGVFMLPAGCTTTINGTSALTFAGTLRNNGTLTVSGGGLAGGATARLENLGRGEFTYTTFQFALLTQAGGWLENHGTINKTANTSGSLTVGSFVTNTGTIHIESGLMTLTNGGALGGTLTNASGQVLQLNASNYELMDGLQVRGGGGALRFVTGGTYTVSAGSTATISGGVQHLGGTLTGAGNLVFTTNTSYQWNGGEISGTGSLLVTNGANVSLNGLVTLGRTVTNYANITWQVGNTLTANGNSSIHNQVGGTLDLRGSGTILAAGTAGTRAIVNHGTLKRWLNTNTSTLAVAVTNFGLMDIQQGTLTLTQPLISQPTGQIRFTVGGLTPATQHGQLVLPTDSTLDGTLLLTLSGYTATTGDILSLISHPDGVTGGFSSYTPLVSGGNDLNVNYDLSTATRIIAENPGAGLSLVPSPTLEGGRVLRWPAGLAGYELQVAPTILGPWVPVLAPTTLELGDNVVRLPADGTRFYRLVRPTPRPDNNPNQ